MEERSSVIRGGALSFPADPLRLEDPVPFKHAARPRPSGRGSRHSGVSVLLDRTAGAEDRAQPRQPIFNVPVPILVTLAILLAVHVARLLTPDAWDDPLLVRLAFVPGRLTYAVSPERVLAAIRALAAQGDEGYRLAQAERFWLGRGAAQPWTTLTYALVHADWPHVGLNSVWLLAFGTPVARRFRGPRFFAFLAATAWAGALTYWALHPLDLEPMIGASAAVSGCMGATLRFMFQPRVPMSAMLDASGEGRRRASFQPAQPLGRILRDRRALVFLVAWFATNLIFGLGSTSFGLAEGPIAWEAHIGGFLAGLLLFGFFDPVGGDGPADLSSAAPSMPDEPPSAA